MILLFEILGQLLTLGTLKFLFRKESVEIFQEGVCVAKYYSVCSHNQVSFIRP